MSPKRQTSDVSTPINKKKAKVNSSNVNSSAAGAQTFISSSPPQTGANANTAPSDTAASDPSVLVVDHVAVRDRSKSIPFLGGVTQRPESPTPSGKIPQPHSNSKNHVPRIKKLHKHLTHIKLPDNTFMDGLPSWCKAYRWMN